MRNYNRRGQIRIRLISGYSIIPMIVRSVVGHDKRVVEKSAMRQVEIQTLDECKDFAHEGLFIY